MSLPPRTLASELLSVVGQQVRVSGWLNNVRPLGTINFVIVRDRTGFIQVVVVDKEDFKKLSSLQPGSILTIQGKVVANPQAALGVEIVDPKITIDTPIHEIPPVEYYKPVIPSDLEHILDHRPIALRNRQLQAVFRIQAELTHAYRLYMHDKVGASEYFAPNIIGASSEGGAEFFNVDYFGYTATLAQSSQLYKQIMVGVNERVFALMPFFRAENSNTPRHLTEGKQFEFEMGFFNHWHDVLDVQEGCIKFMIKFIKERCQAELAFLDNPLIDAPENVPFPRVTFQEAQEIFYKRTGIDERHEPDLSPAAERELCAYAKETAGTDLIFVTDWLTSKRPFYACPNDKRPEISNTFDLLCAGTEITSGGERRHTYASMVEGILSKGMNPDSFQDYLSIFKYGMPPHGGFGMGLERLTMTILRLKNIREASLFPSDPRRIASNRLKAKIFFGAENIRNEIIRLLKHHEFEHQHLHHEQTPTSEDSARVRNMSQEHGVKAIIVRGKNSKKNYQLNILSHLKLDMKAVADAVGEKCEFEDPEVIKERFGLTIGGVPPFGNLLNIETIYDSDISHSNTIAFNCGLLTESIVMKAKDLIALVQPKIVAIAKKG
jgi:nondiscriminating aspartyl-tRNA synthetase